jgi:Toprim-like
MATLPGADIRGYYAALGIELPAWAQHNAPVRCFADPDAHRHEDRNPSCSVDLQTGAWNCHGCGAHGGAYDAALSNGHTPRSAIDLMIRHGLTQQRPNRTRHQPASRVRPNTSSPNAKAREIRPRQLAATEADVVRWQQQLAACRWPLPQLRAQQQRLWRWTTMQQLGLGWDRRRITIPIRDRSGRLQGVLRYAPRHTHTTKMLAIPGTRLGLIPHPAADTSPYVVLVEGPPDMIAARSRGIPAIAVPGDHAWDTTWAPLLSGRRVAIIMDADSAGRAAAKRIAHDLEPYAAFARTIDPAPGRDDGYDLSNWLDEQFVTDATALRLLTRASAAQRAPGLGGSSSPNEPNLTGSRSAQDPPAPPRNLRPTPSVTTRGVSAR